MNKNGSNKSKKCVISWETHPKNLLKNFCSLMEHQSLVDVVLSCGSNTIQAHKFVLAANSPLFREEFEKNPSIQQITISGCDFAILKCVVEIMYCGHTLINELDMKFFIAIIRLFEMKYLENVFLDHPAAKEEVILPKPQFLTKKPKYPSFAYQTAGPAQNHVIAPSLGKNPDSAPVTVTVVNGNDFSNAINMVKPLTEFHVPLTEPLSVISNFKSYARGKRTLKQQAEQACVKEAQASRLALASLQKEIAAAPQINSFIIEDTCAETTVENFIPHPETNSLVQVLNYNDLMNRNLENVLLMPMPIVSNQNSGFKHLPTNNQNGVQIEKKALAADKLKSILEGNSTANVEVMYKDADGNYVPVNEEVLQSLAAREGLQYQVIDEDGQISELQEVQVIEKIDKLLHNVINAPPDNAIYLKDSSKISYLAEEEKNEKNIQAVPKIALDLPTLSEPSGISDQELKFSPEMFFNDIGGNNIQDEVTVVETDDVFVETTNSIKTEYSNTV